MGRENSNATDSQPFALPIPCQWRETHHSIQNGVAATDEAAARSRDLVVIRPGRSERAKHRAHHSTAREVTMVAKCCTDRTNRQTAKDRTFFDVLRHSAYLIPESPAFSEVDRISTLLLVSDVHHGSPIGCCIGIALEAGTASYQDKKCNEGGQLLQGRSSLGETQCVGMHAASILEESRDNHLWRQRALPLRNKNR